LAWRSNGDAYRERFRAYGEALCAFVDEADLGGPILIAIEAPVLRVMGKNQGSHLYEVGWLMSTVYEAAYAGFGRDRVHILEVPVQTVRKQLFGNGGIGKAEIPVKAYRKYGVAIDRDPKLNKLEAWCLWRFGCDYCDGLVGVTNAKRGSGGREQTALAL